MFVAIGCCLMRFCSGSTLISLNLGGSKWVSGIYLLGVDVGPFLRCPIEILM